MSNLENHKNFPSMSNGTSCYSNLANYGVQGAIKGIIAPRPVSLVPEIFNILGRGHAMPPHPKLKPKRFDCSTYKTLDNTCPKSEFFSMFSNKREGI